MSDFRYPEGEFPPERFLANAKAARHDLGANMLCAECGTGIDNEADFGSEDNHDMWCGWQGRDLEQEIIDFLAARGRRRKKP